MQTKKTNEAKVVYAVLLAVIAALSVLVIVTGIMSRRSKDDDDTSALSDITSALDVFAGSEKEDETSRSDSASRETDAATSNTEAADLTEPSETDDISVSSEPTLPEFIAPIDGVVSKEHSDTVLVYSLTMNDYRTHTGVDIASTYGAEVVAAADGVVLSVWSDPMWGYCISISHEGDAVTVYRNLTESSIKGIASGDIVYKGEIIGAVGESAIYELADEPHLHFEMTIGGVSVDPCDYIEFADTDTAEG